MTRDEVMDLVNRELKKNRTVDMHFTFTFLEWVQLVKFNIFEVNVDELTRAATARNHLIKVTSSQYGRAKLYLDMEGDREVSIDGEGGDGEDPGSDADGEAGSDASEVCEG